MIVVILSCCQCIGHSRCCIMQLMHDVQCPSCIHTAYTYITTTIITTWLSHCQAILGFITIYPYRYHPSNICSLGGYSTVVYILRCSTHSRVTPSRYIRLEDAQRRLAVHVRVLTVSFHNFKSQNFKSSVSTPKSKYVAYLSVLSRISNCQGLGRKNKLEILKTDRTRQTVIHHHQQMFTASN